MYTRHVLSETEEGLFFEKEFRGSTRNVIASVLLGKADAGAAFSPAIAREEEEVRAQIRTILRTKPIPPHPFCAHRRVPLDVRATVTQAVLALSRTPEGAELLRGIGMPAPVAADYERDYQPLEAIDVKSLSSWGQ